MTPQRDSLMEATYTLLASGTPLMLWEEPGESGLLVTVLKCHRISFQVKLVSTILQIMGMAR